MIDNKTVFILGAGASMPYGFPLGQLLKDTIARYYGTVHPKYISEMGFDESQMNKFAEALSNSPLTSVDSFLESRPDFIEIGKTCIGAELLVAENENRLFKYWQDKRYSLWEKMKKPDFKVGHGDFENDGSWYQELFLLLKAPIDKFKQNNVVFITFNYDRSLEQYLYLSLKNTYGANDEQCRSIIKEVPIIHVYGHLGLLPWQAEPSGKDETSSYIANRESSRISIAVKNIDIIRQGETNLEKFNLAFEHLQSAKRICVIGFGFNEENIKRLRLPELKQSQRLYGTVYGLSTTDISRIRTSAPILRNAVEQSEVAEQKRYIRLFDSTAYQFMRQHNFLG